MNNIKVIKEKVFGDCTGAIYIDLVHEASEIIACPEILNQFCSVLYSQLYKVDEHNSLIVCFNDENYFFNNLETDLMADNLKWYKIYKVNESQFCDQIEIEEEIKEETIAEDVCINEAFDIMRKEIDDNMTDCKFRVKAYQEVYDCLEHYERAFFFIVDEEESCMITSSSFDMEKYYIRYSICYINEEFTIKKYTKGDQE